MISMTIDNSAAKADNKSVEPRVWIELRTKRGKLIGKICPQTKQLEVIERGTRDVIDLPLQ